MGYLHLPMLAYCDTLWPNWVRFCVLPILSILVHCVAIVNHGCSTKEMLHVLKKAVTLQENWLEQVLCKYLSREFICISWIHHSKELFHLCILQMMKCKTRFIKIIQKQVQLYFHNWNKYKLLNCWCWNSSGVGFQIVDWTEPLLLFFSVCIGK